MHMASRGISLDADSDSEGGPSEQGFRRFLAAIPAASFANARVHNIREIGTEAKKLGKNDPVIAKAFGFPSKEREQIRRTRTSLSILLH